MLGGDLYMFLDGCRGIMDRVTSYFIGNTYVSNTVHIHLDPDSVTKRMDRVRGVAVHNVHETMKICTSQWPKGLRSQLFVRTTMALRQPTGSAQSSCPCIQPVACSVARQENVRQKVA